MLNLTTQMETALRTRGLSRRMGRDFAIDDVSLTVPVGAVYGLLGANGAGKTTLLRLVLDLLRPDRGEVEIMGVDTRRHPHRARMRVGYVPDRLSAPAWMTVERAMRHHAVFYRTWDEPFAQSLISRLRLPAGRKLAHLSKGEAGKLSLLLALAHRPELLILDEPTESLDPLARREFMELLLEFVADSRATVVMSSHLVQEVERCADWIAIMKDGALAWETPIDDLRGTIKRLRLGPAPHGSTDALPFTLLARERHGREEIWVVRGWEPGMGALLAGRGVDLRQVIDLELEECYVELMRTPAVESSHAS
jgi:ABC-2 type transport system ATP-binding protein